MGASVVGAEGASAEGFASKNASTAGWFAATSRSRRKKASARAGSLRTRQCVMPA